MFRPGILSPEAAARLNALWDAYQSQSALSFTNTTTVQLNGSPSIVTGRYEEIDARITDVDEDGLCTWEEVEWTHGTTSWTTTPGGLHGQPTDNPAIERNGLTDFPVPLIVRLTKSILNKDVGTIWHFDLNGGAMVEVELIENICPVDPAIADGSITTPKIDDGAVTADKIADGAALKSGDTLDGGTF